MRFKLRDYQEECVDTIVENFNKMDSQIVQLPTGAGKTVILWHVIKNLKKKTLILAPTVELTEQIQETGWDIVCAHHIYRKKKSYWPKECKYLVMTSQAATFALKGDQLKKFNPDLIIIDEAHRARSKSIEHLINHFRDGRKKILGLTATPERLDGKSLLTVFDDLTYSVTLIDLIQEGYLVDIECYKIKTKHELKEMSIRGGDFAPNILNCLDVDSRNSIILDIYKNKCPGKKTLVFCLSVEHAKRMSEKFIDNGIRAAPIYGQQSRTLRRATLQCFKNREIDVLCNCQLLTEGFDEPSIEALILARPTKSKALYCQMIGRGVRPWKGKDSCLVYDLSDEIHDVQNFNVIGGISQHIDFEWEPGEKLTNAVERHKLSIPDVDYYVEEFHLYKKCPLSEIYAHKHQKELMKLFNIPFLNDITMEQAAYLIFKTNMMRLNGIDTESYWNKWRDVESLREDQGLPSEMQMFLR